MAASNQKDFSAELNRFKTVNTKDSPVTMADDELPILMNFMPIGTSLYSIPGYSASPLVTIGSQEAHWTANNPVVAGLTVIIPTVQNGVLYLCTGSGTTGNTEPATWNKTGTTSDGVGGVVWTAYSLNVLRFSDVNLNGVIYRLVATVGGALYLVTPAWVQYRLCVPGTFTNPMWEQWKYTNALVIDPTAGYYDHDGIPGADRDAGLANATGNLKVKTSNAINFVAGTTQATKAATDTLWTLTGGNLAIGSTTAYYLYLDTSGAASVVRGSDVATPGTPVMPAKDTTKSLIGMITIANASAGVFTPNTTVLTTAGLTVTYTPNIMLLHHTTLSAPSVGASIAVWKGRVWIGGYGASGRTVFFSAPDSFTDFQLASAGGSVVDNYPSLRVQINALYAAQDYLYVVGDHAVHAISGIQIFAGTSTTFNLTDAVPGKGSAFPDSVKALGGDILMVGTTGVHAVAGGSYEDISSYLDGEFPGIDTSFPPVALFAKIFSKLVYVVLVRLPHPVDGSMQKMMLCFYEGRWFYVFYGQDFLYVAQSATATDTKTYGAYQNIIIELFTGESYITKKVRSKAMNFGVPFQDKQILNIGATLVNNTGITSKITATISTIGSGVVLESAQGSAQVDFIPGTMNWLNVEGGNPYPWQLGPSDTTPVTWVSIYNDMLGMSQIDGRGKRIQIDYEESSTASYSLTGLMVEGQYGASR